MNYSVVIPAYNAAATIRETIDSVLAQTISPAEIIVVDDGSTDNTAEVAAACSSEVRVVFQKNQGVGVATTRGMEASSADILTTVDADDVWLPEKMSLQLDHLKAHPDCHGVFTHLRTFRTDGIAEGADHVRAGWGRSTLVIYRQAAVSVGPVIVPDGGRGDMVDWIGRAREMGLRLVMLDDVLVLRRVHIGSMSYGRDSAADKGYVRAAWLALQCRKGLAL